MIKIIDGRNSHAIPVKTTMKDSDFAASYINQYIDRITSDTIYCLRINDKSVSCVARKGADEFILCSEYKTLQGFKAWLLRTYPTATLI